MTNLTPDQLRAVIETAKSDTNFLVDLIAERDSLARELLLNPESSTEIISGKTSDKEFTSQLSFTKGDRLTFLQTAIDAIRNSNDGNLNNSSSSYVSFN